MYLLRAFSRALSVFKVLSPLNVNAQIPTTIAIPITTPQNSPFGSDLIIGLLAQ